MFDAFLENITKWNVILGLCMALIAFVLMIISRPLTNKLFATRSVEERASITLGLKIVAGVLAIGGCVIVMFINI